MGNITKYLIIGPSRSGSTLLSTALDQHPEIVCYGEVLHDKGHNRMDEHHSKFKDDGFCKDADTVQPYMEQRIFQPLEDKSICGCKVTYPHIFTPGSRLTTRVREYITGLRDVKIIHTFRYNLLESYVSNHRANKSNVWWSYKPLDDKNDQLHVSLDDLRKYCTQQFECKQQIENVICKNNELIEITYEDLCTDFTGTIKKALNFLGADDKVPLKPQLHKIETRPIWERITNYKEIVNGMFHSPYLQNVI